MIKSLCLLLLFYFAKPVFASDCSFNSPSEAAKESAALIVVERLYSGPKYTDFTKLKKMNAIALSSWVNARREVKTAEFLVLHSVAGHFSKGDVISSLSSRYIDVTYNVGYRYLLILDGLSEGLISIDSCSMISLDSPKSYFRMISTETENDYWVLLNALVGDDWREVFAFTWKRANLTQSEFDSLKSMDDPVR